MEKLIIDKAGRDLEKVLTFLDNLEKKTPNEDLKKIINYIEELIGGYSSLINDFSKDLQKSYYGDSPRDHFRLSREKVIKDLHRIKGKLHTFIMTKGYNYNQTKDEKGINITVNNEQSQSQNQSQTVDLENVIEEIKDTTSLTQPEIEEIIKRLEKIDAIIETKDSKSKKWEQIKEVGKYLLDKSLDVGILTLPYLVDVSKKI